MIIFTNTSIEFVEPIFYVIEKILEKSEEYCHSILPTYLQYLISYVAIDKPIPIGVTNKALTILLQIGVDKPSIFGSIPHKIFQDFFNLIYKFYNTFFDYNPNAKKPIFESREMLNEYVETVIKSFELIIHFYVHYPSKCPEENIHPGTRISASLTNILNLEKIDGVPPDIGVEVAQQFIKHGIGCVHNLTKGNLIKKDLNFPIAPPLLDAVLKNLQNPDQIIVGEALKTLVAACEMHHLSSEYIITSESFLQFSPIELKEDIYKIHFCNIWAESIYQYTRVQGNSLFPALGEVTLVNIKKFSEDVLKLALDLLKERFEIASAASLIIMAYFNLNDAEITKFILDKIDDFENVVISYFSAQSDNGKLLFIKALGHLINYTQKLAEDDQHSTVARNLVENGLIGELNNIELGVESKELMEFAHALSEELKGAVGGDEE
ncbi:hypothetical protein GPJ56_002523 [Histomonas meleagridis]|uniref:uncharacterized protein n=1 Tax=Histomonas meleagridis TaxID=135588 RepID=UPI0035597738|nr:hypothetical protein GPJ56_002523 [Histomonas meleagridis]KAH0806014.1 hypothetical protein GO595_001175 [Histomonas meleagridis]